MSATARHTPGEWAVNPVAAQVDAFNTGRPVPVCQLLWPTEERSEAETEANARLIAAAPTLLAALQRIADFSGHYETTASLKTSALYPEYAGYRDAMDEAADAIRLSLRDIARAALAKATGEQP